MENKILTSKNIKSFKSIIQNNAIYVDKTQYLAQLIDEGYQTWFLARPRLFGKSLTISTLESIFSGQNELFHGLSIETRLEEPLFAPRPVIKLDMNLPMTPSGVEYFEKALSKRILDIAESLDVEVSENLKPSETLSSLIERCHKKYNYPPAILIDEYDASIRDLFETPKMMEKVRDILIEFYGQIKTNADHISFAFVTGITKSIRGGIYTGFNNAIDISLNPKYGSLTGFTHEEILRYYPHQIREAALSQGMSEEALLYKMKEFYDGYSFDGHTKLYNPYSILHFFTAKKFSNYWFDSGAPEQLNKFFTREPFTLEDFSNHSVSQERLEFPECNTYPDTSVNLFQLGFLTLRPSKSKDSYLLDFPNMEVRESFARRILKRYCLGAFYEADFFIESVKQAISERNPSDLAAELNNFLEGIPDFIYENHGLLGSKERDEAFYLKLILLAFSALSVDYKLEKLEKSGRNCFALHSENRTWLFELKVSHYKAIPKESPFNLFFPKFETIDILSSAIYEDELVIAESRGEDLSEDDIEKQDAISLKAIEQAERIIYGKEDISSLGPNALYSLMMLSKGSIEHIPMELREKEEPSEEAMLEGDQKLLDKAFKKMIKRHYGQQYKNPVLFAFVINDNLREITTCKYSDGFPKKR